MNDETGGPMSSLPHFERSHNSLLEVNQLINQRDLPNAETLLEQLKRIAPSDRRFKEQLRSKIHFFKGEFDRCIHLLDKAMNNHGEHVGLLCDMAYAQYLKKDYFEFEETVARLEQEYRDNYLDFGPETLIETTIRLGHFFEELGNIEKAMKLHERVLEDLHDLDDGAFYRPHILAQVLRIQVSFSQLDHARENLQSLRRLIRGDQEIERDAEIQRSLVVAIDALENKDEAIRYLGELQLNEDEKRKIAIELIEARLRRGEIVHKDLSKTIENSQLEFEKSLVKIINGESVLFARISKDLPLAQILKLMTISIQRSNGTSVLMGQFEFLMETLRAKDRAYWQALVVLDDNEKHIVEIDRNHSKIAHKGMILDFKRRPLMKILFSLFKDESTRSVDELILAFYEVEYSSAHEKRLKTAIKKMNQDLYKALLINEFFILDSKELKMNESVLLK